MRKLLDGIYNSAAALAALFMVGLLLMVLLSIVSRQLQFHVPGTDAYAGYLMAAAGFLALAHTLKRGEHIRVTLLLAALPGRWKKGRELWALAFATVLGSLFALAGGSKQLAFRSVQSLDIAIEARAAINFALLQDEYREVEEIMEGEERFSIRANEDLEPVLRKTAPTYFKLQFYEVIDENTDESISGTRWVKLELPE